MNALSTTRSRCKLYGSIRAASEMRSKCGARVLIDAFPFFLFLFTLMDVARHFSWTCARARAREAKYPFVIRTFRFKRDATVDPEIPFIDLSPLTIRRFKYGFLSFPLFFFHEKLFRLASKNLCALERSMRIDDGGTWPPRSLDTAHIITRIFQT